MTDLTLSGPRPGRGGLRKIPREIIDHLGGEMAFGDAVVAYRQAKAEHANTEGVAAPVAHPLVEEVVNRYGAAFEIEEPPQPEPKGKPFLAEDQGLLARLDGDMQIVKERIEALAKQIFDLGDVLREKGIEIDAVKLAIDNTDKALRENLQTQVGRLSERVEALTPPRV
jgi:H2-forming N5,N10-methylenetetrahydromethanopterin dehydrogenase-like enzyme